MKYVFEEDCPTSLEFLAEIKKHASTLNLTPGTFCLLATNNAHLPERLRSGGSTTLDSVHKIREFASNEFVRRFLANFDAIVANLQPRCPHCGELLPVEGGE